MAPTKVLGGIDNFGQPKEPIYAFGKVTDRGDNLQSGRNHADYIDGSGYYDLPKFLDHHRSEFPSIEAVGNGQLMPHITSEVDREGLFSQSSHINHPKRARTSIRNYERLVIGNHRIQLIYLDQERVMKKFMDRFQKNDWKEDEDRDDNDFLKLEKEVFAEFFPWNKAVFDVIAEEEKRER